MKITEDETEALEKGLKGKAQELRKSGSEVYAKV